MRCSLVIALALAGISSVAAPAQEGEVPVAPDKAASAPSEKSLSRYWAEKTIDLGTSTSFWIVVGTAALLVHFRRQVRLLIDDLTVLSVGQVQFVRSGTDEIRAELLDWDAANVEWEPTSGSRAPLINFLALRDYPNFKITESLAEPYFGLNWRGVRPWLERVEHKLSVATRTLTRSRHLTSDPVPDEIAQLKRQLFDFHLCLGNLYGFARAPDSTFERPVDLERATAHLNEAKDLIPEHGHPHFCLGAVRGLLGIGLVESGRPTCVAEGQVILRRGLVDLAEAESRGFKTAYHYHLEAFMLLMLDCLEDAAKSWQAASEKIPNYRGKAKMLFNKAAALTKAGRFKDALDSLEDAIKCDRLDEQPATQKFGAALKATQDWDFSAFRGIAKDEKSSAGKTFDEVTRT